MPRPDLFRGKDDRSLVSPPQDAFDITPGADIKSVTRAIYVGTGGDLVVTMYGGGNTVTFTNIPDGTLMPLRITAVAASGTTAAGIVGLY